MRPLLFCVLFASVSACGSDAGTPDAGGAYACGTPWEIVLYNQNDIRSDCYDRDGNACDLVGIAVPNGVPTKLVIGAVDQDKQPCDPSMLDAVIDDDAFSLVNDGNDLVLTPTKDAFDHDPYASLEPSATLTVGYGDLRATFQVMSVIDLAGTWEITVDDLVVGDFQATQSGRFIRWADCAPNDASPQCSSGIVLDDEADLFSPLGSLKLKGWVWPNRAKLNGVWLDDATGNQGDWIAVKVPGP